ncbi:MAG: TetR/AcrR family transcriptional regulator [Gammaproteobacteria bacterium]|nr:MAG: TetR/AcrR family transcriptional regulator [Gammaproteobacteria bacterium]
MGRPALTDEEFAAARDRTCEVALELFEKGGRDAVTLRAISGALGCSPMQPYRYFPGGKNEILATVKTRAFDHFADHQEEMLAVGVENDIDFVETYGAGYLRYARDNPASFRIMFELEPFPEEDYPELAAAASRARTPALTAIRRLIDSGVLHGDPRQISKVLWASVHGLATLHLTGQLASDTEIDDLSPYLIKTLRAGILTFAKP